MQCRIESWWGRDFPHLSGPFLGSRCFLYNWYLVFSGGRERPECSAYPTPTPSNAEGPRKSRAIPLLALRRNAVTCRPHYIVTLYNVNIFLFKGPVCYCPISAVYCKTDFFVRRGHGFEKVDCELRHIRPSIAWKNSALTGRIFVKFGI